MTAEMDTQIVQTPTVSKQGKPHKTPPKGAIFYIKKAAMLILGALITAAGLDLFLIPNNVIDGGVVGLSIMAQTITGMGLGVFLVLFNIPFVYMGYKQIGKSFALSTVFAIIMLSIWSGVLHDVPQVTNDPFLAAIFGGVVTGLGVGIVMRTGGCFDGTEIVAIIMDARTQFSVGEVVMFINLFILSGAGLLFGWDKAMYSLVAYFVIAKMIDVVVQGLDESYAVMIVTNEPDKINVALAERLGRGVPLLYGEGGYTGEGSKTVLPSKAYAKLSCRLVPHQDPERITRMMIDYLQAAAPTGVRVKVDFKHSGEPYVCPIDLPAYKAAEAGFTIAFGKQPLAVRRGGSIPVIPAFEKILGLKTVLMGFGLERNAIHSPNESFGLDMFRIGIEAVAEFYNHYK